MSLDGGLAHDGIGDFVDRTSREQIDLVAFADEQDINFLLLHDLGLGVVSLGYSKLVLEAMRF